MNVKKVENILTDDRKNKGKENNKNEKNQINSSINKI